MGGLLPIFVSATDSRPPQARKQVCGGVLNPKGLKKRYWGQHLWARGYFCATVGAVMQEMIREYIEHQFEHGDKNHFKIEDERSRDEFQS
jgi:putative transposase